jgi:hypothetical protein
MRESVINNSPSSLLFLSSIRFLTYLGALELAVNPSSLDVSVCVETLCVCRHVVACEFIYIVSLLCCLRLFGLFGLLSLDS